MWLSDQIFRDVVAATPLVSIDLLIQNVKGEVLLGQRLNRPAQGFWFVPGGRIKKNETLEVAFSRLTLCELGVAFEYKQARLLGVYEHFYSDSVFGNGHDDPDTHYVVLGYHLQLAGDVVLFPPVKQHGRYRWWTKTEIQESPAVHANSRAYMAALN